MATVDLQEKPAPPAGIITLTPAAIAKAKELMEKAGDPDLYLRMGVKGGGCSGFSYVLELDKDVDEKWDRFFEFDGVRVVVDKKSILFLAGTVLDWTGELLGQGFEFTNPNVKKSCGCGTSFQV